MAVAAVVAAAPAPGTAAASGAELGREGYLVGRVLDVCGRPVVRADVGVTDSSPSVSIPLIAVYTDRRGRYNYPALEPALYEITVRARGYLRQTKSVRVRAGSTSRLDFRLRFSRARACPPSLAG